MALCIWLAIATVLLAVVPTKSKRVVPRLWRPLSEVMLSAYLSVRQTDVVLRERSLRRHRSGEVLELGFLHPTVERPFIGKLVKEPRHPPREPLRLPHP